MREAAAGVQDGQKTEVSLPAMLGQQGHCILKENKQVWKGLLSRLYLISRVVCPNRLVVS